MTLALFATIVAMAKAPAPRSLKDLPYVAGSTIADQTLDLYLPPEKTATKPPLVVYAHGGAWISGDKAEYQAVGLAFAAQGMAAAVINYRLSPEIAHPAHAQDLAQALDWLYRNAGAHPYNPQQIFLIGHSAGAHMAGILALGPAWLSTLPANVPHATIGLEGIYSIPDLLRVWPSYLDWFIKKSFGSSHAGWRQASPALQPIRRTRPWLVIHSAQDELVDLAQSTGFTTHLKEAKVDVTYFQATHGSHFGVLDQLGSSSNSITGKILEFIRQHL